MNEVLKKYLLEEIGENKISHAFLVETNDCNTLANDIFNLLVNEKIISNTPIDNNLSVMVIRPENNLIDKEKILDLQKYIVTKSIINEYKTYFIINAELMNTTSFNKLLKVLEEPNDNIIAFLITENLNNILPTIKSRCKVFKSYYLIEKYEADNEEIIEKLMNIRNLSYMDILKLKKELLSKEKRELLCILDLVKERSESLLSNGKSSTLAMNYKILDNITELINGNVNVELCIDKLIIEMRK